MRAAPPVEYPVSFGGPWALAIATLAGALGAVMACWLSTRLPGTDGAEIGSPLAAMGGLVAGFAAAATSLRRAERAQPVRMVRWDGAQWQLLTGTDARESIDRPAVCIDLGDIILLRSRQWRGGVVWLPLRRRSRAASWHALRVAAWSSRIEPGPGQQGWLP